jgi:DMSO/TMAO reductase YedYZ molybdopterin-dependent catalytic subunit
MTTRRQFVIRISRFLAGLSLAVNPASSFVGRAFAAARRRILPKDTDLQSLRNENPAALDTRHLEVMPIERFQTMGIDDYVVSLDQWRLQVTGKVKQPHEFTYAELLALPAVEENVILICPGVFTIYARWKGVAVAEILKRAGLQQGVSQVTLHGPQGPYEKVETFRMDEVASGKVFLAYGVNGQTLPQKHGFPLRAVAPDRYGSDWVKFVYKIEARQQPG